MTVMGELPVWIWIFGGGALAACVTTMAVEAWPGCVGWAGVGCCGLGTAGVGGLVSGGGGALAGAGDGGLAMWRGTSELEPAPGSCDGVYRLSRGGRWGPSLRPGLGSSEVVSGGGGTL